MGGFETGDDGGGFLGEFEGDFGEDLLVAEEETVEVVDDEVDSFAEGVEVQGVGGVEDLLDFGGEMLVREMEKVVVVNVMEWGIELGFRVETVRAEEGRRGTRGVNTD